MNEPLMVDVPSSLRLQRKPEGKSWMTHQGISFVKSGLRFVGYFALPFDTVVACVILIVSEILGIVEEVGEWQTPRNQST